MWLSTPLIQNLCICALTEGLEVIIRTLIPQTYMCSLEFRARNLSLKNRATLQPFGGKGRPCMVKLRSGAYHTEKGSIQALLEEVDALVPYLAVRPSSIHGAGAGLWTSVDLPAQKPLVLYYGDLRREKAQGRYCIQVGPKLTLDAEAVHSFVCDNADATVDAENGHMRNESKMLNLGRYVNDAKGQPDMQNNLRYGRLLRFDEFDEDVAGAPKKRESRPPCVVMYSTRKIRAGEELLASYGTVYWARWGGLLAEPSNYTSDICNLSEKKNVCV